MTNTPKGNQEHKGYPIRLYVNGQQVGGNDTFMEYGESAEAVAQASAEYFKGEGYAEVETEIANLPRWAHAEPEPTVIVRCKREAK